MMNNNIIKLHDLAWVRSGCGGKSCLCHRLLITYISSPFAAHTIAGCSKILCAKPVLTQIAKCKAQQVAAKIQQKLAPQLLLCLWVTC